MTYISEPWSSAETDGDEKEKEKQTQTRRTCIQIKMTTVRIRNIQNKKLQDSHEECTIYIILKTIKPSVTYLNVLHV